MGDKPCLGPWGCDCHKETAPKAITQAKAEGRREALGEALKITEEGNYYREEQHVRAVDRIRTLIDKEDK